MASRIGASIALLCLATAGCTIVRVDGARSVSIHAGVLRIAPDPAARIVVVRTAGVGLVPGVGGVTLGAASQTAALVYKPEDCRIVLFEPDGESVRVLADLLGAPEKHADTICSTRGK